MEAASRMTLCGICKQKRVCCAAVVWCTECHNGLCSECKNNHDVSMTNHSIITVEAYLNLPPFIKSLPLVCKEHNKKLEKYCCDHITPLCLLCNDKYHGCCAAAVVDLDSMIPNIKSSPAIENIGIKLKEIVGILQKLKLDRSENLLKLGEDKKKIKYEIELFRKNINDEIDKYMLDVDLAVEKTKKEIDQLLGNIVKRENQILELSEGITEIKCYATHLQIFLGTKKLEKTIDSTENFVYSIINSNSLDEISIQFDNELSLTIPKIDFNKYITVSTTRQPTLKEFMPPNLKQVQAPILNDTKVTLNHQFKIKKESKNLAISGLCVMNHNDIVFADSNSDRLIIHDKNGSFKFDFCTEQENSFDITPLDNVTVAVTSGDDEIYIVDLYDKKVSKTLKTKDTCYGVKYSDGAMIFTVKEKGIRKISMSDFKSKYIYKNNISWGSYITTFGGNVCFTNRELHTVTLIDSAQNIIWTFSDKNVLQQPYGVTSDSHGNFYVAGYRSNNVVKISHDGKGGVEVINHGSNIDCHLRAISYVKQTKQLMLRLLGVVMPDAAVITTVAGVTTAPASTSPATTAPLTTAPLTTIANGNGGGGE
ncbi:uncharacterized protein LOC134692459 [Mytilus trossulus]|uniref:uncharacterized protein LOC134692459 n=1 Tax=Mytilus trossulus TaxID=6551 RepID=UPI003006C222